MCYSILIIGPELEFKAVNKVGRITIPVSIFMRNYLLILQRYINCTLKLSSDKLNIILPSFIVSHFSNWLTVTLYYSRVLWNILFISKSKICNHTITKEHPQQQTSNIPFYFLLNTSNIKYIIVSSCNFFLYLRQSWTDTIYFHTYLRKSVKYVRKNAVR